MAIKTLLLGFGGTGCGVVARVRKMIGTGNRNIQFVGFDTDANWDERGELPIVVTSRERTVREYLEEMPGWKEWFPDEPYLQQMSMVAGAAQIRSLSELAFLETINSDRVRIVDDAIRVLCTADGDINPANFRVMIVSSFAGGTGSGMFIQAALWIRKRIYESYGKHVTVRGLFALPDIFADKVVDRIQIESIYANAYASIRELNAINIACSSASDEYNIKMKIPGLFDSKGENLIEKKPYDFIFFVDNINSDGRVLRNLDEYKELMDNITFMQVCSPITDIGDSLEDNRALAVIQGRGQNIFGAAGASRLIYPYKDLARYCGLRATIDSVSNSWSIIDREFRKEDAYNRKQMETDFSIENLDRGQHFVSTVESMLKEDDKRVSFISRALILKNKDITIDRTESYFSHVENYIIDKIDTDNDVKKSRDEVGVNKEQLKDNLSDSVEINETCLKDYLDTIEKRIIALRMSTIQSIFPDSLSDGVNTQNEWNIVNFLSDDKSIVHPLSARMLLYKIRMRIKISLDDNLTNAESLKKRVKSYFEAAYDLTSTEQIETVSDRVNAVTHFNKKKFIAEYLIKSEEQLSDLDKYKTVKMLAVVLEIMLKKVDSLINQYEKLFDSLDSIRQDMEREADVIENVMHQDPADSRVYVCASADEKRELYASLHFAPSNDKPNVIYKQIFEALYEIAPNPLVVDNRRTTLADERANEQNIIRIGNVFGEKVLDNNIAELKENCSQQIDLTIFDALLKSEEYSAVKNLMKSDNLSQPEAEKKVREQIKKNPSYLPNVKELIIRTFAKAKPFLKTNGMGMSIDLNSDGNNMNVESCSYTLVFWGINKTEVSGLIETRIPGGCNSFFSVGVGTGNPVIKEDDEYSKYEISCYQAQYCVELEKVPKFQETGDAVGLYYSHYSKRIKKMLAGNNINRKASVTPHLNINWHKREYLPMINSAKNILDDERAARSFWLGLIYGGLIEGSTSRNESIMYASFARQNKKKVLPEEKYSGRTLMYNGNYVAAKDMYGLFKALQTDETAVDQLLEVFEKSFAEDKHVGNKVMELSGPRARRFAKELVSPNDKSGNALCRIASFIMNTDATDAERQLIISSLEKLIMEFCEELSPDRVDNLRHMVYSASNMDSTRQKKARLSLYMNLSLWKG